jgi:hypothetical protein
MGTDQSVDALRLEARMVALPPSGSPAYFPAFVEMVKTDLRQQWQQGRRVSVESYLNILPELGSPDTVPADLILAECEARLRSGAPAELTEFERRFPRQAKALRRAFDRSPGSATEVLTRGRLGEDDGGADLSSMSPPGAPGVPVKLSRRFGRYRVIKRLGRGAMGSVYLAHDTHLDRRVALKVPHFRLEGGADEPNRDDLDRFYREARIAATFDHPNLCPVYDVGQIGGVHYLSMAYVKGRPLSDYIDPHKPMPPLRAAAIVRKLAQALEVAHSRGVVHRDLKPSNIMVNSRRELIIMDFGVAWRIGSGDERLTKTGIVLGTPAYISPEQLSGKAEALGPRCDVYSLGVIMYELLTAFRPFVGQEAVVLGQILFVEPAPPSGHRPDLDPQIEAICLKAMAKRPEDRYATMGELAAALGDYIRGTEFAPRSPPVVEPTRPPGGETSGEREADEQALATQPPEFVITTGCGPVPARDVDPGAPAAEPAVLQRAWRQWTGIVELFALRRSRRHVDWQDYHDLHQELIEACRVRAAEAGEVDRAFYRHLEDLALPWLTPKTLAQVDRDILFSLLLCCRRAEQELDRQGSEQQKPDPRPEAPNNVVWASGVFLALTIVAWLISLIWSAT